jgi:hypothetical protein
MTNLEIRYCPNNIAKCAVGKPCFYYVSVNGDQYGYLYPDGSIQNGCYQSSIRHGWYSTKEAAEAAIETYNKKEKTMRQAVPSLTLYSLADDALADLTSQKMMFTAYDITLKLRSENPGLNIVHESVRDYITNEYYNGANFNGYHRELRDLPGQNVQAFVYAPTGSDFSKYGAVTQPPTASVPASKVIINATFSSVFTS